MRVGVLEGIFEYTMRTINKKEPVLLGFGDLLILALSLYITLVVRYQSVPSDELIQSHAFSFAVIFIYSIIVFYISGLYGRIIAISRASIPGIIVRAQIASGLVAVALFYFIPAFGVAPKINLFIYIALSTALLILWRIGAYSITSLRRKDMALVVGSGSEVQELVHEMSVNRHVGLYPIHVIDPVQLSEQGSTMFDTIPAFQYIVADMTSSHVQKILPELYRRYFPGVQIVDLHEFYEMVFSRIPLSCMNYAWIMSNISSITPQIYDAIKRALDIILGAIVTCAMCVVYPFVALAIKIEDGGRIFIAQDRMGKYQKPVKIYKFRSMQRNESGKWLSESDNKVTRVGMFIRKTRIDELPQGVAIMKGDISLIGPRTGLIELEKRLEQELPYYTVRTIIKPGLTGWAQINQEKPPQSIEENKVRLSYDLYYIKHRSLGLDLQITLRTIKTLLSRVGM